jgi:predicted  nucleic acid-binding Zn-ribbon protein
MGALNVSSQDEAERLERRLRVLSERLEESEDRLDRALAQVRDLTSEIEALKKPGGGPTASKAAGRRSTSPEESP